MNSPRPAFFSVALLCLVLASGLSASTLGPDCASCFGGVYTVSSSLKATSADGTRQTYRVTYELDLSGYNGPSTVDYIGSIALKGVSGPNLYSAATFSAPTSGVWKQTYGNANSGGCDGSGGGWVCLAYVSGDKLELGTSTKYAWVVDLEVKTGTLMVQGSVQANFDPATGVLMSEKIGMPEGVAGELPLLLVSLTAFGIRRKYLSRRDQIR